jgi:hypothetical protein
MPFISPSIFYDIAILRIINLLQHLDLAIKQVGLRPVHLSPGESKRTLIEARNVAATAAGRLSAMCVLERSWVYRGENSPYEILEIFQDKSMMQTVNEIVEELQEAVGNTEGLVRRGSCYDFPSEHVRETEI